MENIKRACVVEGDMYCNHDEPCAVTEVLEPDAPSAVDPRLTMPLSRPVVAVDKVIRVSFVPDDPDVAVTAVHQDIAWQKAAKLRKRMKPGKVRVQLNGPGGERELILDGVELMLLVGLADAFMPALVV